MYTTTATTSTPTSARAAPSPPAATGSSRPARQCDDGADNSTTPRAPCLQANACGDGFVEAAASRQCDNGDDNGTGQACNSFCALNVCGDLDKGPDEECDDGNMMGGDGCTPPASSRRAATASRPRRGVRRRPGRRPGRRLHRRCASCPACGDSFVQMSIGEQCDLGGQNSNTGDCTLACKTAVCGDGFIQHERRAVRQRPEQRQQRACKANCTLQVCGDGFVGPGEACDDGNQATTTAAPTCASRRPAATASFSPARPATSA
jgi:cysteine-rich repeat protein